MSLKPNSNVNATENTALLSPTVGVSHKSLETSYNTDSFIAKSRSYNTDLERARALLYISHFFSQFSEVSWQFGLVLFLSAICCHKSLLLVSTYGLLSSLSGFAFGGVVGRFVDASPRLCVTRLFIWTENGFVVLATACCYVLLSYNLYDVENERLMLDTTVVFLLLGVHVFGSLAAVLDRGFSVAIERDWVVVMSQMVDKGSDSNGDESEEQVIEENETERLCPAARKREWLSHTNVTMRQIDLTCKVVAPSFTGFLASASVGDSNTDLRVASLVVGLFNILALVVEYECTKSIYSLVPDLSSKKGEIKNEKVWNEGKCSNARNVQDSETFIHSQDVRRSSIHPHQPRTEASPKSYHWCFNRIFIPSEWSLYFSQSVAPAGFALSLL
jgi:iron-regulated transporter 1